MWLINKMKFKKYKKKWRNLNQHNFTIPRNVFPQELVRIGKNTYGDIYVLAFNNKYTCTIGNYCSIAPEVAFILSADHNLDTFSTYPFKVKILGEKYEGTSKGNITVADDVWIGFRATILSGVTIGQGAVVAAGALVTKDVPPYAIVAGVPAHIVKYRFDENIITQLLKIDYSRIDEHFVKENIDKLYSKEIMKVIDYLQF